MGWLRDGWDLGQVLAGQGRVLVDLAGRWEWKGRPIGLSASRHGAFLRAWVSPVSQRGLQNRDRNRLPQFRTGLGST